MIDSLTGGWQTLFPNGGDSVFAHGVEWAYDGEVRLTWMDWEFTGSSVRMTGRLVRSPFEITKIISHATMRSRSVRRCATLAGSALKPCGAASSCLVARWWGRKPLWTLPLQSYVLIRNPVPVRSTTT